MATRSRPSISGVIEVAARPLPVGVGWRTFSCSSTSRSTRRGPGVGSGALAGHGSRCRAGRIDCRDKTSCGDVGVELRHPRLDAVGVDRVVPRLTAATAGALPISNLTSECRATSHRTWVVEYGGGGTTARYVSGYACFYRDINGNQYVDFYDRRATTGARAKTRNHRCGAHARALPIRAHITRVSLVSLLTRLDRCLRIQIRCLPKGTWQPPSAWPWQRWRTHSAFSRWAWPQCAYLRLALRLTRPRTCVIWLPCQRQAGIDACAAQE